MNLSSQAVKPSPIIATLEAGGTKMVAALTTPPKEILIQTSIPTTHPEETLGALIEFYQNSARLHGSPDALAIGTFGPVNLDPLSPDFGTLKNTPKAGWSGTQLRATLQKALGGIPTVIETDVNAALIGELAFGAARGAQHAAYLTIGTGIGGGLLLHGQIIHGTGHPELGHLRLTRHPDDSFPGLCPAHHDCLEGLASGPALEKRWNLSAPQLPPDHPAWEIEAFYLAQACHNLTAFAPLETIILGGGVMQQAHLLPLIQIAYQNLTANYWSHLPSTNLTLPALHNQAATLGCLHLGLNALS